MDSIKQLIGFAPLEQKFNDNGEDSGGSESEEDEFEDLDYQDIRAKAHGSYRSIAQGLRQTTVTIKLLNNEVSPKKQVTVKGKFDLLFTKPWWEVTVHVKRAKSTKFDFYCVSLPSYRPRLDSRVDYLLFRQFMSEGLEIEAEHAEMQHVVAFVKFLEDKRLKPDFRRIMEYLERFKDTNTVNNAIAQQLRVRMVNRGSGKALLVPVLTQYAHRLFPRHVRNMFTSKQLQPDDSDTKKKTYSPLLLTQLQDMVNVIQTEPWILGFQNLVKQRYGIFGCEASLKGFESCGLLDEMEPSKRHALEIYDALKKNIKQYKDTFVELWRIKKKANCSREALEYLRKIKVIGPKEMLRVNGKSSEIIYLMVYKKYEKEIAVDLAKLLNGSTEHTPPELCVHLQDFKDDEYQLAAAQLIAAHPVVVMSGKGGCGKTYVIGKLFDETSTHRTIMKQAIPDKPAHDQVEPIKNAGQDSTPSSNGERSSVEEETQASSRKTYVIGKLFDETATHQTIMEQALPDKPAPEQVEPDFKPVSVQNCNDPGCTESSSEPGQDSTLSSNGERSSVGYETQASSVCQSESSFPGSCEDHLATINRAHTIVYEDSDEDMTQDVEYEHESHPFYSDAEMMGSDTEDDTTSDSDDSDSGDETTSSEDELRPTIDTEVENEGQRRHTSSESSTNDSDSEASQSVLSSNLDSSTRLSNRSTKVMDATNDNSEHVEWSVSGVNDDESENSESILPHSCDDEIQGACDTHWGAAAPSLTQTDVTPSREASQSVLSSNLDSSTRLSNSSTKVMDATNDNSEHAEWSVSGVNDDESENSESILPHSCDDEIQGACDTHRGAAAPSLTQTDVTPSRQMPASFKGHTSSPKLSRDAEDITEGDFQATGSTCETQEPEEGEEQSDDFSVGSILLTAPTGKAATVLSKRTNLPAYTLHHVIYSYTNATQWKFRDVKVLICDECSLVSVKNFNSLLNVLTKHAKLCKLVLIGDINQLPSIEPGNFFKDVFQALSSVGLTVTLMKNHRAESKLIVENADRISQQRVPEFPADEQLGFISRLCRSSRNNDRRNVELERSLLVSVVRTLLHDQRDIAGEERFVLPGPELSQFIAFERKLCKELNEICAQAYQGHSLRKEGKKDFHVGDKVCIGKNSLVPDELHPISLPKKKDKELQDEKVFYVLERLSNGEIFFIEEDNEFVDEKGKKKRKLVLDDGVRKLKIDFKELKKAKLDHAWARTIHTFQGSEMDTVVYVCSGSSYQNWQHVYTAVSRGRRNVIIVHCQAELETIIRRKPLGRNTRLKEFLLKEIGSTCGNPVAQDTRLRDLYPFPMNYGNISISNIPVPRFTRNKGVNTVQTQHSSTDTARQSRELNVPVDGEFSQEGDDAIDMAWESYQTSTQNAAKASCAPVSQQNNGHTGTGKNNNGHTGTGKDYAFLSPGSKFKVKRPSEDSPTPATNSTGSDVSATPEGLSPSKRTKFSMVAKLNTTCKACSKPVRAGLDQISPLVIQGYPCWAHDYCANKDTV